MEIRHKNSSVNVGSAINYLVRGKLTEFFKEERILIPFYIIWIL